MKPITFRSSIKDLPIRVYCEKRYNSRVSIGKNAVYIRIPQFLSHQKKQQTINELIDWADKKILEKPTLLTTENYRTYNHGCAFHIYKEDFIIERQMHQSTKYTGFINQDRLIIKTPEYNNGEAELELISKLVAKVMSNYFLPVISDKIHYLNSRFFRAHINTIKLKNNSSNWGSCSSKSNINISTRLLFAPDRTVDYVLIHELAHLFVPNHSSRFWNLVERVMPEYRDHELWLKEKGHQCIF